MRLLRRGFSCLLAFFMMAQVTIGVGFAYREDGSEVQQAAYALYELGLFQGTGVAADGSPIFELERSPSRNEAVTMLVRLLGRESEALSGSWRMPFTDVAGWAKPYVGFAYGNGLTSGTSSTTYSGEQTVSATQYLTFLLRALGYSSELDFRWDRAWELADRIGITHGEYGIGTAFTRGDVALVSYRALAATLKGQDVTLLDKLAECAADSADSGFEITFIDLGQADAALVRCDGHCMLIDGGNVADSQRIYTFLRDRGVNHLDYVVCTHPHEDHVGGLAGALNYASVDRAFCSMTAYNSAAFNNFVRYLERQGKKIEVPAAEEWHRLGSSFVQVLGPVKTSDNVNNMSIVLRFVYGNTSFLFTGDAERDEEADILEAGYRLRSTVLKVGHHGSSDSTTYPFLREVAPQSAVISVGSGNPYGHPTENTLSRLRDAEVLVYRTDMQGDVLCRSDGKNVTFSVSRNSGADTLGNAGSKQNADLDGNGQHEAEGDANATDNVTYVLNTNTMRFHLPSCLSVEQMSTRNKLEFSGSRDEVVAMGYIPCSRCHP